MEDYSNMSTSVSICIVLLYLCISYLGITCAKPDGVKLTVTSISLSKNNLRGSIPNEIGGK